MFRFGGVNSFIFQSLKVRISLFDCITVQIVSSFSVVLLRVKVWLKQTSMTVDG